MVKYSIYVEPKGNTEIIKDVSPWCECSDIKKGECYEENIRMLCNTVPSKSLEYYKVYKNTTFYARRKESYLSLLY